MPGIHLKKLLTQGFVRPRDFFPSQVPLKLKELYLSNAILTLAQSASLLFEPIYLYTLGFSLSKIMLFYAGVYGIYLLAMPLGGKVVKWKGFEHGMIYGSFFMILYYVFLLALTIHPGFLYLAIIALALQKTFFWPGYHADFAFFGQRGERARELSAIVILDSVATIAGPIVGGILAATFGFPVLFLSICAVVLLSNLPFLMQRELFKPSHFSYTEVYRLMANPENRRYVLGYIGYGEELIVLTVWPIFIFVTFQNMVSTGFAVAISTLVTSLLLLYVGRESDLRDRKTVLKIGGIFTCFAWLLRLLVKGGGSILLVDFFSRTSKHVLALPMLSGLYEYATTTSVVRTVIFFEMSLALGKLIAAVLLALLFAISPANWHAAFVLGGAFSLLYLLLGRKSQHAYVPVRA